MLNDNFEKGYAFGSEDRDRGKGKRIFYRPIQRLVKPDAFLGGFKVRFGEYLRGYNKGYEDQSRTIHTTSQKPPNISSNSSTANSKGTNMSNLRRDDHIEILVALKSKLAAFQEQIIEIGNGYSSSIDESEENGLLQDFVEELTEAMNETRNMLSELYYQIENEDNVLIDSLIAKLEV